MYRRGLKPQVKKELMRDGAVCDDLDSLIRASTRVDDQIHELAMELRHDGGVSGLGHTGLYSGGSHGKKRFSRDPYGPMPMELDFTEKKKPFRGKKQQGGKKAMNCYGCGKPGHIARDCRSKNMVKRPQLNILERVPVRKTEPPKDQQETEYDDTELDAIMDDLLALVNPPINRELQSREEELREEIAKKQRNIAKIEQRLADIHEQLKELDSDNECDGGYVRKGKPEQSRESEDDSDWENLSQTSKKEGDRAASRASTSKDPQTKLEERVEFYQEKVAGGLLQKEFRNDSAHPQHGVMHWSACADETCMVHYQAKINLGKSIRIRTCGKIWSSCNNISCHWHLATKRSRKWFPNHDQRWHSNLHGHLKHDEHTSECHLDDWYACFHDNCRKHMYMKRTTGFLSFSGKE